TCHEQGATHAADGYARATGKVGVVIATSGPGATNLLTGIATAHLDSTPLVAITGNVPSTAIGRDGFQEVDITGVTMPITKHNYIVKDVRKLAATVREAFRIARSGRPGPVLIDIPKDVQLSRAEYAPETPDLTPSHPPACDADIERAAALIREAERPFLYAGGGAVGAGASEELLELSRRLHAPIGSSMMGLTCAPQDYPLFLGMTGMHGRYAASRAMYEADLIVAVGTRVSDRAIGNQGSFAQGQRRVLHIDIDPAEIGKNIPAYASLTGDVKRLLGQLLALGLERRENGWLKRVREILESPDSRLDMGSDRLNPQLVIEAVQRRAPKDALVATDVGQHQMWTAQYYRFNRPRSFITSGGLGTMGFGLGAAIGACIGSGRRRTVLFTSDGSFHMNMNELATAVTNRLPLTVVLLDNNALGMVRQWQTLFFDKRYSQTTLNRQTDYVRLAEAFGAEGLRVGELGELDAALERALGADGPVLLDVKIDPDERVLPMIPPGGTIDDIILY
ncbi:MAG: biosynthetic-type acetolactate synthase large subunit, partial [Christensenellaceae bacterium]|nr:biosynthetic-type acetolactate synthase large subunit [Christensenellaceae bacterium]